MKCLALLAASSLGACGPSPSPTPPAKPTDLALIIALARECVRDVPSLDRTPVALGPVAGKEPAWGVTFFDAARPPRSSTHVTIDPVARTCDGRPVTTAPVASHLVDIDALVSAARRCAVGSPWFGEGAGMSPLVLDTASVSYYPYSDGIVVRFEERVPRSAPNGLDLSISFDGTTCGSVAMD